MGGIYIPNINKPEICDYCFLPLTKCEYFSDLKLERCPLVEIVTCGECKHSKEWYGDRRLCYLWAEAGVSVFEGGYCNYGERRGGE